MVSSAGGLWESSLSTSPSHSVQMLWSLSWPFKDSVPHSIYLIYFINIYLICVCPPFNQDLIFQYLCPVLRKGIGHSLLSSLSHHSLSFLDLRNLWVHWIPPNEMRTHMDFSWSLRKFMKTPDCTKHAHLLQKNVCMHSAHIPQNDLEIFGMRWPIKGSHSPVFEFWHGTKKSGCFWGPQKSDGIVFRLRYLLLQITRKGRIHGLLQPIGPQVHGEKWG